MSSKKSAARFDLLASSSIIAALAALAGVALTPGAASAANECGDPGANGATADTFVCAGSIPSISYAATNGNLTLQLQGTLTVTGGISITPTGANSVTLNRPNAETEPTPGSGDPQISNSAGAAINIERAAQGAITLSLNDNESGGTLDALDTPMAVTGTTAAIRIRNVGTGTTTINLGRGAHDRNNSTVTATAGAALDLGATGTGSFTINTASIVTGSTAAISVAGGGNVGITQGDGARTEGELHGRVLLSNTGNTTFSNRGLWTFEGVSELRNVSTLTGTTTLTNLYIIRTTGAGATIDFGAGVGTFTQRGYLVAGATPGASTLTLRGVDTWTNSGMVFFGQGDTLQSDGETNDRIVLVNDAAATFTGAAADGTNGLLIMDVDFTASQAGCAAAVTADCLDLRGHNTAGTTLIQVNSAAVGLTAQRIVLVDVAGAGTDAGVFSLSPTSTNFRALGGGMVDAGLFLYELGHDATARQHVLTVAAVDQEAVELNLAARSALPAWEAATGSWFDRQADLRNTLRGLDGGVSPGAWLRVAGTYANEKKVSALEIGGDSIDVITSNTQDTVALVGGVDLVGSVGDGGGWVAGVTFGKVTSELGFKESPNGFEFDGHSLGAYASYATPSLFIDAIVNTTRLDTTYTGASLGMSLEGEATSIGYRLDGGWRFDWGDGIWFEPLAALSYVTTELDDMPIATGVAAEFDEMTSFRGSLGARLSGDIEFDGFSLQLAGTGRVWKEFDGESASAITTGFGDFSFTDEAEDTVGEVGVSLGLFGAGGRLSAQLGTGVEFREGYQSVDVTLGARYQW